jgi:peptidoglycan/LPS O-acetylase OafA/YrhL
VPSSAVIQSPLLQANCPANETSQPTTNPVPAKSAPAKSARYESLDLARGLCCLMLVVFHTTMQTARHHFVDQGGSVNDAGSLGMWIAARTWIGVPIFFVISGYCIMAALHARQNSGGLAEFAKRRFWRIYPPYWMAIALSTLVIIVLNDRWPGIFHDGIFTVPHAHAMSAWEWFGNLTLTESWRHCVMGGDAQHLLPNTWTLCYEEQFYVVAGLILILASRRLFTAAAVVTGLIVVGKAISWKLGWDVKGSLLDGGWFQIAAGILLYYRVAKATPKQIPWINAALAAGVLLSLRHPGKLLEFYPNHDTERFVAFSFALLASLFYRYDRRIKECRWLKPLAIAGGMSYSVYLIHPLIAKGVSFGLFRAGVKGNVETLLIVLPICVALSIAGAYVFHRLVERHFIPPAKQAKPAKASAKQPLATPSFQAAASAM